MLNSLSRLSDFPPAMPHRRMMPLAVLAAAAFLTACVPMSSSKAPRLDASGASTQGVYPVTTANIDAVRARAIETVNARRAAAGVGPVTLDTLLVTSADRGSASMSRQNRAWLYGDDGTTPSDRAARAGYQGELVGELVSETWENEIQTIDEWMRTPSQRSILLDPNAQRAGVGVYQEESMKLWWTLTLAR